jgi:hypothetical protein
LAAVFGVGLRGVRIPLIADTHSKLIADSVFRAIVDTLRGVPE